MLSDVRHGLEADVTVRQKRGPQNSACLAVFFEILAHSRPQVTRSPFNSLPVALLLSLRPPLPAACAPQSALGLKSPRTTSPTHTPTCSCLSLLTANEHATIKPVDPDSRPPAPCPTPDCALFHDFETLASFSHGSPHTAGL